MMTMSSTGLPSDIDSVKAAMVLRDQSGGLKLLLQHDLTSVARTLYCKLLIQQDALKGIDSLVWRSKELVHTYQVLLTRSESHSLLLFAILEFVGMHAHIRLKLVNSS